MTLAYTSSPFVPQTILANVSMVLPDGTEQQGCLRFQQDRIVELCQELPPHSILSDNRTEIIPLNNKFALTPGLIDIQINGAFGCDFNNTSIPQMEQVLQRFLGCGITGILPTLITAPLMDMVTSCNTIEELIHLNKSNGVRLLGIHLEGPFLNPKKRGAHPAHAVLPPNLEAVVTLLSPNVKLMTMAPECDPQQRLLQFLKQREVKALAGHTEADLAQLEAAIEQGLQGVTHLFNAMDGFHHRKPGTALFAMTNPNLCTTFIADGVHCHPEVLRLLFKVKALSQRILVSDAMALAGCPEGSTSVFAEQSVTRQQNMAVNTEGNLAGSAALLPEMIANLVRWNLCSFAEAIQMAAQNPATLLGLENDYGQLKVGAKADMVLWEKETLKPVATWLEGRLVWCDTQTLQAGNIALGSQTTPTAPAVALQKPQIELESVL
jgi:N-acetylglucosamine-6-phosphate deacetylase